MKKILLLISVLIYTLSWTQTCNKLNHTCNNTTGLYTNGITANAGSTLACSLGDYVLYSSSGSDPYIATDDIAIDQGMQATLHFDAKRASSYFGTGEVWVHIGGYCNFTVYDVPYDDNGWVQIGTFNPGTSCSQQGPFTVPSDMAGGQLLSYCIVLKGASSSNFVSIDNICVSQSSGSVVPTTMNEDFGTSSSGWYPNAGVDDIPYHTYKNASDAYVLLGSGVGSFPDKAAYFYTGFDFCSSVSGVGIITKEINTSGYTNGEIRIEFKSKYPCSGTNSYTFDENYQSYSPEIYVMTGADNGSNTWTQLPVNYYFADYNWRVASYDISAYKNANVRFKIERGGFCSSSMEAVDNIKIIDRDCSISLESCGPITGETAPLQNTQYPYSVAAVTGASYYKWYVRHEGNLYDTSPYIVSGQGTQNVTIDFQNLPSSDVRVLCIPYDTDPSTDSDACYAEIAYTNVTVTAVTPLAIDSIQTTEVSCSGSCDGTAEIFVSGGQPPYSYSINGGTTFQSASTFNGLCSGTYFVTVSDQSATQVTSTITINEPPALFASCNGPLEICLGDTTQLNVSVGGGTTPYSYSWNPNSDISNNSIPNPFAYPSSNTTYSVDVMDANGCIDNCSVMVTVNPVPNVSFSADTLSGCEPLDVTFTNNSSPSGSSCIWDFGDGNTANACGSTSHTYSTSGSYDVSLSVTTAVGCSDTLTLNQYISVNASPSIDLGSDTTFCGDTYIIDAGAGYDSYNWSTTETTQSIVISTTGDYWVTVEQNGCFRTDTIFVERLDCSGIHEFLGEEIKVYPNPVKEMLYLNNIPLNTLIEIYSMDGKLIQDTKANQQIVKLDLRNINSGTYLIKLSSGKENYSFRIVKQ